MRLFELLLSLCLLGQIVPAYAQGPSLTSDSVLESSPLRSAPRLAFTETELPNAPEGHLSLSWNSLTEGTRYEVTDDEGQRMYQGEVPLAFISGLPDGTHKFYLKAYTPEGQLLAEGAAPAIVPVKHWSLTIAFSLFGIGLVVFVILIGTIVHGTLITRGEENQPLAEKPNRGTKQETSA
ncbi:hypothetical protein FF011L_19260 [Roseimaritima multifibrata]|uniref:Fibronectin type-III domain-containing protein n=1 Tax=Roseimaritima multifibrata TaxID=1930274 RepID=A0A517ME61_9BACT|nr:hypothetical protein [Roseimaritima multifibrata]QDS93169.1 hypothetical protein FF011L_19260 [Roseimaritima multifibrata]